MNIMVTGGLGVNGAWVTRQLLEQGHRPIVYENRMDSLLLPDIIDKIDIVIGDIMDLPTLIRTIKEYKIQRICHLAALMPDAAQANPLLGFQVNAMGTLNILEAARIMDVERVVFTSSMSAFSPFIGDYGYPNYMPVNEDYPKYPTNMVYGATKVASELMCFQYKQNYGLDFVALRFCEVCAIGKKARHGTIAVYSTMIENAMLGKPTVLPQGGDEKADIVYVKDVAHSIVLSCFARNLKHNLFNIGAGKGYKLGDITNAIRNIYPDARFDIGPGLDYFGLGPAYCIFDTSRTRKELGFEPRFTLEEGIRDYVETMKQLKIEPTYNP